MTLRSAESLPFGALLKAFRTRQHLTQQQLADTIGVHRSAIIRWEQGDVLPGSKTLVLELTRHLHLDVQEARHFLEASLTALSPYWSVPLPRNPFFTGREELLERLHALLPADQTVALSQSAALHGLGGIGKTQIALEYAYRHALVYSAVFWIAAETAESCLASLVQIAEVLQLPGRADQHQQRVVVAVQHWLATHRHWLLIWDNVEDLELLDRFLPSTRQGAILLTTRCQTLGTRAVALDLVPMEHEEGVLFLLRRAKVLEQAAIRDHLRQFALQRPAQYQAAAELVTEMGGLPLALDQAGAYLEATCCGLPAYLELFRTKRAALLQERGEGAREHPESVWATFTLALAATTERHPAVGDLLRVCALLQAEAIPEEVFRQGAAQLGAALEALCRDGLAWNRVVASACAYSLVSRHPEEQTLALHRLVQAILVDTMTQAERAEWSRRAIAALDAVFPVVWYTGWKQGERLVPHALACLHRERAALDSLVFASLALKVARYLRARGQYAEVGALLQRAVQIREQLLGPEHLGVASALHELAVHCVEQGKYEQARPLYLRVLRIQEQGVAPTDSRVVWTLNNLAQLYWTLGTYGEAEVLYQRALHRVEQAPTLDGYLKAEVLNNMAYLYRDQGRGREAEALFEQAVVLWRQTRHPHASTPAESQSGLAPLFEEPGRAGEAEAHDPHALGLREQGLGLDPPEVVYALYGLAGLCREQGRAEEAEAIYQRALFLWEQQLGETHPGMAHMLTGLAGLYREHGRAGEAEPLYQRALALREQAVGAVHPEVAETLHEWALFRQQQGRLHEARSLAERALSIRSQSLGATHPKTIATQALSAHLLQQQTTGEENAPAKLGAEHRADPGRERGQAEKTRRSHSTALAPALGDVDPLQGFLDTCCEVHPLAWCRIRDLWQTYEHWMASCQGGVPLSRRAFAAQLKARGCRVDRTSTARIWRGIRLGKTSP